MNEGTKTGIFWVAAAAMAAIATLVAWPRGNDDPTGSLIGTALLEKFTDPLVATSLKIVTFDESLGELESFEVAKDRKSGVWTIPSRQGYPADASNQMQAAGTALLDLKILDVKTDKPEEHSDYGVVQPDIEKLRVGDTGVGRLVSIRNEAGDLLVSLIIGNIVKDFPTHRYVRVPNQDPVYEVELDDAPLTTEFRQWIEEDLLQLSGFDIAATKIRNYSVSVGMTADRNLAVDPKRKYDANLSLNESNQWQLDNLFVYDEASVGQVRALAADETLNTVKLNKMKSALDDLKIVDVLRKPEGMSADLKADNELVGNKESFNSLIQHGFYAALNEANEREVLSANGETIVDLKDGVQYVLRFGTIAGIENEDQPAEPDANPEAAEDVGGANRYLLVTARVNEAMIPPPAVMVVPQTYEELEAMLNPPVEEPIVPGDIQENPLALPESGDIPTVEPTLEPTVEPKSEAPAEPAEPAAETPAAETPATTEEPASDAVSEGSGETEAKGKEEGSGAGQDADEPVADVSDLGAPDNAPATEEPPVELTVEEKQERLEAEQEKLIKENQRLRDAWKEKVDAANARVRELNSRFADWYYIVPNSTYKDLQFGIEELIAKQADTSGALPGGVNPADGPAFPQFNFGNPGQ